jgi:hypothetical protein
VSSKTEPHMQVFICGTSGRSLEWEWGLQESIADQDHDYDYDLDMAREAELGHEYVHDDPGWEWPFYADCPYEVEEPEII